MFSKPIFFQNRLLEAIRSVSHLLTPDEKRRNTHGPHLMYTWTDTAGDAYPSTLAGVFPDIAINHAQYGNMGLDPDIKLNDCYATYLV